MQQRDKFSDRHTRTKEASHSLSLLIRRHEPQRSPRPRSSKKGHRDAGHREVPSPNYEPYLEQLYGCTRAQKHTLRRADRSRHLRDEFRRLVVVRSALSYITNAGRVRALGPSGRVLS